MDAGGSPDSFQFDGFRLDRRAGLFKCVDGAAPVPINMGSRALGVLTTLVQRSGNLVSKDEILAAVWPKTIVDEANLSVQISALRKVLDQGRSGQSCIQTVPGRGYRFVLHVVAASENHSAPDARHLPDPAAPPLHGKAPAVIAGAVVLLALSAMFGWGMLRDRTAPPSAATFAASQDRRQSVIVLPFENSSGDPARDDLASALTRALTDRIAQAHDGPVVPAVSASAYRGTSVDLQAIGRHYNVHFAVVGSVRRQAGRLVASANVYTIADNRPVWSRQFDLPDGPDAATTVMQNIYEGYWQTSVDVEADRAMRDHPDRLDKRDLMNAALATRLAVFTKEHLLEKMSLTDRALALDPNDEQGLERRARLHVAYVLLGFSSDPDADLAIAEQAADRLLAVDANHILALRARTAVLTARGDWPAAEAVVRRALALQPTEATRHFELGFILMGAGRHQEALQSFENARRFAGGADPVYSFDGNIAMANLAIGQLAAAIAMAQAAISELPPDTGRSAELPWLALIAATSDSGWDEEARAHLQKFLASPRSWRSMSQIRQWPAFAINQNLLTGLRNAGLPEE
jgi:DNA-binding winged helix-turn-helix (wHTH) protein/TolB-like protein/tetratricopeptide (TPR) repeat protein